MVFLANTVVFWANKVVFGANTVVFGENTVVFYRNLNLAVSRGNFGETSETRPGDLVMPDPFG